MSTPTPLSPSGVDTRRYLLERVDDAAVVQLYADGFVDLPLREKVLIFHLYQAAVAGRDIYYDQRYAHNLAMRDVLEEILTQRGHEEIRRHVGGRRLLPILVNRVAGLVRLVVAGRE